jgi:hypothetical protein
MFDLSTWRNLVGHRGLDGLKGARVMLDGYLVAFRDEPSVWWPGTRKIGLSPEGSYGE